MGFYLTILSEIPLVSYFLRKKDLFLEIRRKKMKKNPLFRKGFA